MSYAISPPILPMLAKAASHIPSGDGWLYEPKWDGFRAIVFRDEDALYIGSRNAKPLLRYFPELESAMKRALPQQAVVDGEIVIAGPHGLDFDALQLRIHPAASRVKMLSETQPSMFVAFDLLALNQDLRTEPLDERRRLLEESFVDADDTFVTPQTSDIELASTWFDRYEGAGLDGIVAKRHDLRYRSGDRAMVKVKHLRTVDCVVGGYRISKSNDGISSLLLGLYRDGSLHYVGHTSSFKTADRRSLLGELRKLEDGKPSFGTGRSPGGASRWTGSDDKEWVTISPVLVCEVAFDHMQGDRFRHGSTFVRWRADKQPDECTWEQLELPNLFDLNEIRRSR
ncbi:MAG: ATP-dependent DNA ligase [Actinomycetota bacterium]